MLDYFKRRRRERVRAQPFPAEWRRIIERNVAVFRQLPLDDQAELLGHVQVLIDEKNFEGCGGLELTDEIRITVAAQASVLLLHREPTYYPRLSSILIYPSTYDQYGATNPAEFFAVATEFFFEKPRELRERHAALYAELRSFSRQDPAEWPKGDAIG